VGSAGVVIVGFPGCALVGRQAWGGNRLWCEGAQREGGVEQVEVGERVRLLRRA